MNLPVNITDVSGGQPALVQLGQLAVRNGGSSAQYNITAATVVKATPGRLVRIDVITAGSAAGTANDCATTGAAAVGNQIASIPNTVGSIELDWPCATGIVIVPGTSQVLAVSYV